MSSKMYNAFKTDQSTEVKGIWLDFDHFRIRIARAGGANKAYQKALEEKTRPFRKAIQAEVMEDDKAMAIFHEVYADTIVRAWETRNEAGELVSGIEDEQGNLQPFNRENVIATFQKLPDLFDQVREDAAKSALFRQHLMEVAAGN